MAPALIAQARKRISSAKESWSAVTAGDQGKFKLLVDQFSLVADSLVKLHPASEPLARVLTRVIAASVGAARHRRPGWRWRSLQPCFTLKPCSTISIPMMSLCGPGRHD